MQRTFQFVFLATFHKQRGTHVKAAGTLTLCTYLGNRLASGSGRCHCSWQPRVAGKRRANGQNLRNSTSVYTSELLSLLLLTALGVASLWSGSKHEPYSLTKYPVAQPTCRFFIHCITQKTTNRLEKVIIRKWCGTKPPRPLLTFEKPRWVLKLWCVAYERKYYLNKKQLWHKRHCVANKRYVMKQVFKIP
jgi:hypothetical protein